MTLFAWGVIFCSVITVHAWGSELNNSTCDGTPVVYFVSTTGNDAHDGRSPQTAWASPGRALAAITFLRHGGPLSVPVEVNLLNGVFFLSEPIVLAAESGGSGACRVVFQPYSRSPGTVTLSGGRRVGSTWTPVAGTTDVFMTMLNSSFWPQSVVRQMYAPHGKAYMYRTLSATPVFQYSSIVYGDRNATVVLDATKSPPWLANTSATELSDAYVVLYHTWTTSISPITSWAWPKLSTTWTSHDDMGSNRRMIIQNAAGALAPGTFLFNSTSRILTYRLAADEDAARDLPLLIIPSLTSVIKCDGTSAAVESVSIVNLTIAHSAAALEEDCMVDGCSYQACADGSGAAVHLRGARGWELIGVEVAYTGQYAVWIEDACAAVVVKNSWLHDLGGGGIRVGATTQGLIPNPESVTRDVYLADSIIEDGGQICAAGVGVVWHNAANGVIEHNTVRRLHYTGISVGWTWSYVPTSTSNVTVRKNAVSDIGMGDLSDMAGIYLVGPQPGSLVDGNVVTNITRGGNGAHAFYIDQACSGSTWTNNIGWGARDATFQVHYGMNNSIVNNVLALPSVKVSPWPCAYPDDCGLAGLRSGKHPNGSGEGAFSQFVFERNIIVLGSGADAAASLFVTAVDDGLANMSFAKNVYWGYGTPPNALQFPSTQHPTTFTQWQGEGKDAGSTVADPMFVNAFNGNFSLLPGSPALARGFAQIDVSDVGPRSNAYFV